MSLRVAHVTRSSLELFCKPLRLKVFEFQLNIRRIIGHTAVLPPISMGCLILLSNSFRNEAVDALICRRDASLSFWCIENLVGDTLSTCI